MALSELFSGLWEGLGDPVTDRAEEWWLGFELQDPSPHISWLKRAVMGIVVLSRSHFCGRFCVLS